ncbi:MAG: hypothetical protein AAFZ52_02370 [Bacteroidota bacterium]
MRRVLPIVFGILLIPLVAMGFTNEVRWGPFDFLVAAVLLTGIGLLIDSVLRKTQGWRYRIPTLFMIIVVFVLVWAELAVGLFGTPLAGD